MHQGQGQGQRLTSPDNRNEYSKCTARLLLSMYYLRRVTARTDT